MPAGDIHGLSSGASVVPAMPYVPVPVLDETGVGVRLAVGSLRVPMGNGLLGRVVDAQGCRSTMPVPCRMWWLRPWTGG